MVRHYGSDRSCCLPRTQPSQRSCTLFKVVVWYCLLVVQSARSMHSALLIVFFQVLFFFQSNSNFVKSGSGPEHWSFEPDTERVGIRLRPGLKSQKFDCITSTDYYMYVRSTRLRRRGKTTLKGRGQSIDHEAYGLCS